MVESERVVDERYIADGWLPLSKGWPDRAYVRSNNGKIEVRFVEIKSPSDTVDFNQALMHMILRDQGLDVRVEPASKTPLRPILPREIFLKMLEALWTCKPPAE
jgi:hypothetical protein